MVDDERILQLRAAGVSQRGIADALGCLRNAVQLVLEVARLRGVEFEQVTTWMPAEVRRLLLPEPAQKDSGYTAPDFDWIHSQLVTPKRVLAVVWNEYASSGPRKRRHKNAL